MATSPQSTSTDAFQYQMPRRQSPPNVDSSRGEIDTLHEMRAIVKDPTNEGRTYRVSREVFDYYASKLQFLPRPAEDIPRINAFLGTIFDETARLGMTRTCICQHCAHEFSFADHVESAIRMGVHSPAVLKNILAGDTCYLTVDTQKPRAVLCVKCEEITLTAHCCYASQEYGYAHDDDAGI